MITGILYQSLMQFLAVMPILTIAIVASQAIKAYLHKEKLTEIFKENEKNIAKASAIGIMTPGPLLAFLPLLKTLKDNGLPFSILAAFITGQTLIGPARLFLEVEYFGVNFFILRVIITFLIAIGIATSFRVLEKYINF